MGIADNKEELLMQVIRLSAQNESLKEQLQESEYALSKRNRQIDILEKKISALSIDNSQLNNCLAEVEQLENNIGRLKHRVDCSKNISADLEGRIYISVSKEHDLSESEHQYTLLQTLITDLQQQLQNISDRNLILQQQNNRIVEFGKFDR